tara:strand:+ start:254966 stop:255172 length:207 start_codon:yes stop_codon:yes gene_type:complete
MKKVLSIMALGLLLAGTGCAHKSGKCKDGKQCSTKKSKECCAKKEKCHKKDGKDHSKCKNGQCIVNKK